MDVPASDKAPTRALTIACPDGQRCVYNCQEGVCVRQEGGNISSAHAELTAMGRAYDALCKLPLASRARALDWLSDRLQQRI